MKSLICLNVGCGNKFHKDWINIDVKSNSPFVIECDIRKGIPYESNYFDVVYSSQVLEHFSKKDGHALIAECYRVLKTNGIIRIVVPDLENIVREYIKILDEIDGEKKLNQKYHWILLELIDQIARNSSGGELHDFITNELMEDKEYIFNRIGYFGQIIREFDNLKNQNIIKHKDDTSLNQRIISKISKIKNVIFLSRKEREMLAIGKFRVSGEVHYWMYDKYSLQFLLRQNGFISTKVQTPFLSDIPNWDKFELDVKNNQIYDPQSLFVEAIKGN